MTSPAHEAAARAADQLGKAVLPYLLGQLDGTTESFRALAHSFGEDPEASLSEHLALTRVEEAQGEAHRIGWFLGCLASASGTDLLIARREDNGLRLFCGVVLDALAGETHLTPGPGDLPRIATGIGRGWELSFLAGFLFYAALCGERDPNQLAWKIERGPERALLGVRSMLRGEDGVLLERLGGLLPEVRARAGEEWAELVVPAGWLVSPPRNGEL